MYILDAIRTRCLNFRYFMSYKKSLILLILLFVCSEDAFSQNLNASVQTLSIGAIGVVGPTRLNYSKIVPLVDYTSKIIGRILN